MQDEFNDSGSQNSDKDFKDLKENVEAKEVDLENNKYECPSGHELRL